MHGRGRWGFWRSGWTGLGLLGAEQVLQVVLLLLHVAGNDPRTVGIQRRRGRGRRRRRRREHFLEEDGRGEMEVSRQQTRCQREGAGLTYLRDGFGILQLGQGVLLGVAVVHHKPSRRSGRTSQTPQTSLNRERAKLLIHGCSTVAGASRNPRLSSETQTKR